MIISVIKSNGKKEDFSMAKLRGSIERAVISAGHSLENKKDAVDRIVKEVIADFKGKADVRSTELREKVLKKLDKIERSASDAWEKFDQKYKSTKSFAW